MTRPIITGKGKHNIERARELGTYEPYRERLTQLREEGLTSREMAEVLDWKQYRVEFLCKVLQVPYVLGRPKSRTKPSQKANPLGVQVTPCNLIAAIRKACPWDRGW